MERAGLEREAAEAVAGAIRASQGELVTRDDLRTAIAELRAEIANLRAEMNALSVKLVFAQIAVASVLFAALRLL